MEAIGFDMDYTLAQYKPEFDLLAYAGAAEKLVDMGYPKEVLTYQYDPTRFSRGLVLDKVKGNLLKMDRFKYVRVASHGSRRLTREGRQKAYRKDSVDTAPTYTGREYVNIDTQFQIVDAALFEQLVDLKDRLQAVPLASELEDLDQEASKNESGEDDESGDGDDDDDGLSRSQFVASKSYLELFTDIRACVDMCHRDGVIKDQVAKDPSRYIVEDPNLFPMLQQFRLAGKKVFLLTNSYYDYTDTVMTFLLDAHLKHVASTASATASASASAPASEEDDDEEDDDDGDRGDGDAGGVGAEEDAYPNLTPVLSVAETRRSSALPGEWANHFDLVVVGACKPAFMLNPKLSLFRVQPHYSTCPDGAEGAEGAEDADGDGDADGDEKEDECTPLQVDYSLKNSDGVGPEGASAFLREGIVFQGGNWLQLHAMLGVSAGNKVLYVGDHTYSDILRSKRTLGWRTCLVIPELEGEMDMAAQAESIEARAAWEAVRSVQAKCDERVDALSLELCRTDLLELSLIHDVVLSSGIEFYDEEEEGEEDYGDEDDDEDGNAYGDEERSKREALAEALADELEAQSEAKKEVRSALALYHQRFHSRWGQIFVAGSMDSRFAKQVADYACVYTTRASDFAYVSPTRDFRPIAQRMPHDQTDL